jgi:uncharacterized SAM-binding protein YcdF (DUF218 family)
VRDAALIAVAASGVIGFFGVGRWLVIEDPLQQAHTIVVLSGAMPIRALEAARIYRQGFASRVWVTHSQSPAETLRQMGISYVGEEFYSRKVLMSQGVPEDAIRVFELQTSNTESELTEVARLLQQEDGGTVIVVTTKPHTRRVRAIWKRVAGPERRLIVRYPADDPYDGAHWWRHTRDALDVVRELLGLLNAWAGFPVHAQSR